MSYDPTLASLARELSSRATSAAPLIALAVQSTGQLIARNAQLGAPVDTGALRASITSTGSDHGLTATIGPSVNYGGYVERGTSRMGPRPFLQPAFDRAVPVLQDAIEAILDDQ